MKKPTLIDKPAEYVQEAYQKVFGSYEGRMVLYHMLKYDLCFFDEINNDPDNPKDIGDPVEIVLSNYARRLLYRIGIWGEINARDFMDALFKAGVK